jgi:O-antigen ligase
MASQIQPLPVAPDTGAERARRRQRAERLALRSRLALRAGLRLAIGCAALLGAARFIDVSADGKAMLLFGTGFSIAATLSALFRPRWFLLLVTAYLPFSKAYALPVAGISGANMTNLLMLLGLVAGISSRFQGRPGRAIRLPDVLVALFVAVASLAVAPAYAADPDLVDLAQTYRAWVAPMFFYFLARVLARDRQDVRALLLVIAVTTVIVALDTCKEGFDRSSRGSIEASRVRGLMEQANSMGAFLVYYGVPFVALALVARPRRRAVPYLLGFLLAARANLFTFSRGAQLAMAAGSATVLLFGSPALLAVAGLGAAGTVAAFPSLLPESIRERWEETTTNNAVFEGERGEVSLDKSSAHRLVLWRGAARMIAAQPLTGVGLGRFAPMIGYYTEVPLKPDDPHDAHNAFILLAAEMGVPSLLLLLIVYAAWALAALRLRARRRDPIDRSLGLAFLGSLAGVLVSCMLGSRFSDEALIGWFWMLAALVVVLGAGRRRHPAARPAA